MFELIVSFLFLAGWATNTIEVLFTKKNSINPLVSLFFTAGVIVSATDSYYKGDPVFLFLGVATLILAFINFYYIPQVMKIEKQLINDEKKIVRKGLRIFKKVSKNKKP